MALTATITITTWTCPWCTVRVYSVKDLRAHQYVAHRQPCGCLGTKHAPACLSGEQAKMKEPIDYVKPIRSLLSTRPVPGTSQVAIAASTVDKDARLDCPRCSGWTCTECGYYRTKVNNELLPTTCVKCGGSSYRTAPTRHRTERALKTCKARRYSNKEES